MYLISLNCSNLLILLNVIANLLRPLLQGALGNRLGHLWHLDDFVCIGAELLGDSWKWVSKLRCSGGTQKARSYQDSP